MYRTWIWFTKREMGTFFVHEYNRHEKSFKNYCCVLRNIWILNDLMTDNIRKVNENQEHKTTKIKSTGQVSINIILSITKSYNHYFRSVMIRARKFMHSHVYFVTQENILSEVKIRFIKIVIKTQRLKVHVFAYFGYFGIFGIQSIFLSNQRIFRIY